MSLSDENVVLNLQIDDAGQTTMDELDATTRQLQKDLEELAIESVEIPREESVPPGTKSAEAATVGALAVTLVPLVIPKLMEFLKAWLSRGEHRRVKVKVRSGSQVVEVEASSTVSTTELKAILESATKAARSMKR
jgi:hypothetical protein